MTMPRRTKTRKYVKARKRVVTYKAVTRMILQCERPYVLFGEAVRDARHALKWNQQELADKMKMSRGSIANIETGRQRILLTDLFDFAKVLRVKPIIFFNAVSR
jgi:ribosome-binding protein aMBF1 (putative translation factor)